MTVQTVGNAALSAAQWDYRWPAPDAPRSGSCGDGLTWTLSEEGVLTVSGTGEMAFGEDGAPWGASCQWITTLILAPGVRNLPEEALAGFTALDTLYLPDTVAALGEGALSHTAPGAVIHTAAGSAAAAAAEAQGLTAVTAALTEIATASGSAVGGSSASFTVTLNAPLPVPVSVTAQPRSEARPAIP